MQSLAGKDLQIQLAGFRGGGIGFQFGNFVFAIANAHVPAGNEFQVFTDQLRQALPQCPRAIGQFQLAKKSSLTAHVAEIHAAGILADLVTLQQGDRTAVLAQKKTRRTRP
ncbi:hypothetical protein IBA8401_35730 [Pseudomonas syringae]